MGKSRRGAAGRCVSGRELSTGCRAMVYAGRPRGGYGWIRYGTCGILIATVANTTQKLVSIGVDLEYVAIWCHKACDPITI